MKTIRYAALAVAAWVILPLVACTSPENPAKQDADTIVAALTTLHPNVVCDNGDAGVGIDNEVPWFTVYLVVDQTSDVDRSVTDAAAQAGFRLEPDPTRASRAAEAASNAAAGLPRVGPDAPVLEPVPAVESTSFLAASDKGRTLRVAVARTGPMNTFCRDSDASGPTLVEAGRAAVIIEVVWPTR